MRDRNIAVTRANMLYVKGGGFYETNSREKDYAALHFLCNYLDIIANNMACNGEPSGFMGDELLKMANKVLDRFMPFVEKGIDIFAHDDWERNSTFQRLVVAYNEGRQFLVTWGEGYEPKEPVTVGIEFFTKDNGFTADITVSVIGLELEDYTMDYSAGEITIQRVK